MNLRFSEMWIIFDSLNIYNRSDSCRWQNKHLILICLQTIKSLLVGSRISGRIESNCHFQSVTGMITFMQ